MAAAERATAQAAGRGAPRPGRAPARQQPKDQLGNWLLSALLLIAVAVGAGGMSGIIKGTTWWFMLVAVASIVLLAAATVRAFTRRRGWGTVGGFFAAIAAMTLFFVPSTAILGIIPTFDSFGALHDLEQAGLESIANQVIPARVDEGILYLLCLGIAAVAVAIDGIAFVLRARALTGLPLVVLLLVPSVVRPELNDAFFFALTAAAYLGILVLGTTRTARRVSFGLAAFAIVSSLVLSAVLPPVLPGDDIPPTAGFATGVNPIITLGDDLRQGDPTLALTYSTSAAGGVYLRLTALDDFSGSSWTPTTVALVPGNDVSAIGTVPGLGADVPAPTVTTDVTVANILSRWLPAPYAPRSVTGLTGTWSWEQDALAIRSAQSNARGQEYEVQSVQVAPTVEQLLAAGTTVDAGMERYLAIPDDLPSIVASTAREVVGAATTNYEKALALQAFFHDGDFTYSEDAPVKAGYDGSGAKVLAAFLAAKSGYCVHFSSAMASMARTLGIPARVAVGFTPGSPVTEQDGTTEYRVTTHDLHAWPELYFAGIGWVRFEPTPGRGILPAFAPAAVDDPATPQVDESTPPVPTPTPTAEPTAGAADPTPAPTAPAKADDPTDVDPQAEGGPAATSLDWVRVLLAVLAVLLVTPMLVRLALRARRLRGARGARGAPGAPGSGSGGPGTARSSTAAWEELRCTADDLGLGTSDGRTPRQFGIDLAPYLDDAGVEALARVRAAVEAEVFASGGTAVRVRVSDVRLVLRSLRRGTGLVPRLLATIAPRSLVAAWLPRESTISSEG